MKKYQVRLSYFYLINAKSKANAIEKALKIYNHKAPRGFEMDIKVIINGAQL